MRLAQYSNLDMHHACMITRLVTWYECAIAGYNYLIHSQFSELLPTVNRSISPRRNGLPLPSHHKSGTQCSLRKYSKTISKLVLAKIPHPLGENIQKLFRLQNRLSRESSNSWKYSNTFSLAKLSKPQIINILEIFKHFFACIFVLVANHHYPGNIQRLFRLQNCLSRKSPISLKYSRTSRPASSIPAATSNHPAINKSNQQQQSTAAINSHNQQQQPAATTGNSKQL